MPARRSLTLYAALLFAAVAALVVSAVGFYLYRSVEEAMLRRSDVMVATGSSTSATCCATTSPWPS